MTAKTFIRLIVLSLALTASAVLFATFHSGRSAAQMGEEGIQCKEKCDDNKAQADNTEIWESISRHLLGTNQ